MPTPVRIQVVNVGADGAFTPADDAQVVVGRRDLLGDSVWPHRDLLPTHAHSGGHYVNTSGDPKNEPDQGEWLLVVRAKDRATVVQQLTFTLKDDIIRAQAGWGKPAGLGSIAATVSIANYADAKEEVDAERPKHSVITVKLFPALHFVSLACDATDATFDFFSTGRRDRLFDIGELNPGSHAHLISTRRNVTEVFVKSQSASVDSWVKVAELTPQGAGNKNGILEFYRLLHELGQSEPGTVHEAAYWGHGWHNGPVVRNSGDDSDDHFKRWPEDFDGRPKDWHPKGVIAQEFPKLKDALRNEGRVIWGGCSHMTNVIRETAGSNREAKKGTARDEFYLVNLPTGRLHTTLDHTKRNVAQFVHGTDIGRYDINGSFAGLASYIGLVAQQMTCAVFGAPPGAEANLGRVKGSSKSHQSMKILTPAGGENIIVVSFFKREFGDAFEQDDLGYANYTKLFNDASLPDPGWRTERYAFFTEWEYGRILRLPSGFIVQREKKNGSCNNPIERTEGAESGHFYVLQKARPYYVANMPFADGRVQKIFHTKDDSSMDLGIFVTKTGKTLLRIREGASKEFVVPPKSVPLVEMKFISGVFFEPTDPLQQKDLPIGELESVVPKWYW